jgi:HPt (histidine-containing phosphotransfer) domain-containing protein
LKGSAQSVGAVSLSKLCVRLTTLNGEESVPDMTKLKDSVTKELERTHDELNGYLVRKLSAGSN